MCIVVLPPFQAITVQAALLYTSSNGERRLRVHTMVLPVTNSLPGLFVFLLL